MDRAPQQTSVRRVLYSGALTPTPKFYVVSQHVVTLIPASPPTPNLCELPNPSQEMPLGSRKNNSQTLPNYYSLALGVL